MPVNLVKIIDDISKMSGVSRSKFISDILYEKVLEEKRKSIKKAYDNVFSDELICEEQLGTANWFENANSKEGQEW